MKKLLFIISLAVLHTVAFAQQFTLEADSLTQEEMKAMKEKIIVTDKDALLSKSFFKKWEKASAQYARSHSNPKIDSICQKVFTLVNDSIEKYVKEKQFYKEDNCKYTVIPSAVKVQVFDGDYKPTEFGFNMIVNLSALRYYIPHIVSKRPLLYDFPTIHKVRENYLSETEDEMEVRENELRRYIPADFGSNGSWHLCTMPIINSIKIYHNGVMVDARITCWESRELFLPYGSDEIETLQIRMPAY
ncbi:MAG: hypothetical protein Q4E68_04765 [Prevotellaceae bacterium]|nr:hypothetical protein [Prevotellaceae bacterium]